MEQQEYLIRLQMLEQQASQFGEQLRIIDQQVSELANLKEDIINLEKTNEGEMFSEIGKGIYIKGKLDKKQILVDVGNKILIPKNNKEIQSVIAYQIKKFDEIKKEISNKINQINKDVDSLIKEVKYPKKNAIIKKSKK